MCNIISMLYYMNRLLNSNTGFRTAAGQKLRTARW